MGMEGDLTRGAKRIIHCTSDVLSNCTPETCVMPVNTIKKSNAEISRAIVLSLSFAVIFLRA